MTNAMNTPEIPSSEAGDTPTPGDELRSEKLASASPPPPVTADVAESPEGAGAGVKVSICSTPPGVSKDRAFTSFMRRYIDMASASGPGMDQPGCHIARQARPVPAVALGLLHPFIQRLRRAAYLARYRDDR